MENALLGMQESFVESIKGAVEDLEAHFAKTQQPTEPPSDKPKDGSQP
jgi:hypothetical protein